MIYVKVAKTGVQLLVSKEKGKKEAIIPN